MDPREIARTTHPVWSSGAIRLRDRLAAQCWPGGSADRREPSAAEWLRRWQPRDAAAMTLTRICGCRTGTCSVCN